MHAPPEREDTAQYVRIAELFAAHGIGVPHLHAFDTERGFVLMEDFDDDSFERAYARGDSSRALDLAIETLVRIQGIKDTRGVMPDYEAARFQMELGIFSEWFLGGLLEQPAPCWYAELAQHLVDSATHQPKCPIHRDYHCRNLLITPAGKLGVVDFQDALIGPVTYDLASLLGDCYHQFTPRQVDAALAAYGEQANTTINADFRVAFGKMVIQRQLKAVGIFARLWLRDGKHSHLASIEPVLSELQRRARQFDALTPLAETIEKDWQELAKEKVSDVLT